MPLNLVEMTRDDFLRRRGPLVASYAASITVSRGLTVAEAETEAARDVDDRTPRGPATPGQLMRKALVDGAEVGWIWVSLPGTTMPTMAWLSDVEIDPAFRSRGHGADIITAVEAELAERGVPKLGLNVFGDNPAARRLYERLGFEVTAQQRSRALSTVPPSDGIELVPLRNYEARIETLFADYAQDLVQEEGLWHGEAEARAARKLTELLPQGARTDGMLLRTIMAGGDEVGWLWAGLPAPPRPGMAWLHNIDIDAEHRSLGYGRSAIAAVEAELVHRGVRSLGLNVHGYNTRAQHLYEKLGYEVLAEQMTKDLPAL